MDSKHSGTAVPKVDTVVLLADEEQPRNVWRMGRISNLKTLSDGAIREAEVKLPNGHVLRRQVNRLVPLKIQEGLQEPPAPTKSKYDTTPTA
ncbi:hypothetical protein OSTOST_09108, partial [Ostertagia ostertagi]